VARGGLAGAGGSHDAEMGRQGRRQRRIVDGGGTDWIVVRNRLSVIGSRNKKVVGESLSELGLQMGFRMVDGFGERVVYREFFPRGLTALDQLDEATLGMRPNLSHVTARQEVRLLLDALKLPIDEKGRRRAAARARGGAALRVFRRQGQAARPARYHRRLGGISAQAWPDGVAGSRRRRPGRGRSAALRAHCAGCTKDHLYLR